MQHKSSFIWPVLFALCLGWSLSSPRLARAHCDTMKGPVIADAREALQKGDVTPVLKWVPKEDEEQIREAFKKTLAVRSLNSEARELADMYFFETLVRIHRAGEGAPYLGLKSGEDINPAVALADEALETGSAYPLIVKLTTTMSNSIHKYFELARNAEAHANDSVEAGREYVAAYILFTHYVEDLSQLIAGYDTQQNFHRTAVEEPAH